LIPDVEIFFQGVFLEKYEWQFFNEEGNAANSKTANNKHLNFRLSRLMCINKNASYLTHASVINYYFK
jgi:hypothetical protein